MCRLLSACTEYMHKTVGQLVSQSTSKVPRHYRIDGLEMFPA